MFFGSKYWFQKTEFAFAEEDKFGELCQQEALLLTNTVSTASLLASTFTNNVSTLSLNASRRAVLLGSDCEQKLTLFASGAVYVCKLLHVQTHCFGCLVQTEIL